jgi:anti-sigma factor RsiW
MHGPLCCERIEVGMSDYLENVLDPPDRIRFESHLAVCVECWRDVQSLRQVAILLAGLEPPGIPDRMKVTLSEALERAVVPD